MGMNYYWNPQIVMSIYGVDNVDMDDPRVHIGKMCHAGLYCRKCGITQKRHTRYVHIDKEQMKDVIPSYLDEDVCPHCGQPWETASSFTFTMMGHLVTISNLYNIEFALRNKDPTRPPIPVAVDEYGVEYTAMQLLDDVIRTCPIQFQDYGRWS